MSNAIEPFEWAPHFETGLETVDEQHHRLVDLINLLSNRVASGQGLSAGTIDRVLDGLSRYASFHFTSEEALMLDEGVDQRHTGPHFKAHADFVAEVERMREAARRDSNKVAPVLLRFVTGWMTFHILDSDQTMARQIRAIRDGVSPADAFEQYAPLPDPGNAALLGAVHSLLGVVAQRNIELAAINNELEARVEARTKALRGAERRLMESEKLAAVGQLAAGVAHEINNPLSFVSSNIATLREYSVRLLEAAGRDSEAALPDASLATIREELPGLLDETADGLGRVTEIVAAMREMAETEALRAEPGRLENVLQKAVAASACSRAPGLVVSCTWDTLPAVRLSKARLQRAFQALLDNAARAVDERGSIRVLAGWSREEVWVDVIDNGCGMTPEVQDRLFEPFFTTRAVGSGRGLGLTLARQVVLGHGGRIEVKSASGEGSRFRVVLPRIPADQAPEPPASAETAASRSSEPAKACAGDPA